MLRGSSSAPPPMRRAYRACVVVQLLGLGPLYACAIVKMPGAEPLVLSCACGAWAVTTGMLLRKEARLRARLREHDNRLCPACQHSLRGAPDARGRCPECGTSFDIRAVRRLWRRITPPRPRRARRSMPRRRPAPAG